MSNYRAGLAFALALSISGWAQAQDYGYSPMGRSAQAVGAPPVAQPQGYAQSMGEKAASGAANMALGWLEIPKNVINTANEMNMILGIPGGFLKGTLHTVGRTLGGIADLLTFPLPTQPIVRPSYVWENFYTETQYGPVFKTAK